MHCPLCIDTDLDPVFRSGIEVDRCPRCKGIWLDRGELDKLLDDGPGRPEPVREIRPDKRRYEDSKRAVRHEYDREHSYEYKTTKKSKKKKSKSKGQKLADLLEDVLDF